MLLDLAAPSEKPYETRTEACEALALRMPVGRLPGLLVERRLHANIIDRVAKRRHMHSHY